MEKVGRMIDWGMARFRGFTIWDVGVFKLCMLSIGMLIGGYIAKPLSRLRPFLWAFAAVSYIYILWRMIFIDET